MSCVVYEGLLNACKEVYEKGPGGRLSFSNLNDKFLLYKKVFSYEIPENFLYMRYTFFHDVDGRYNFSEGFFIIEKDTGFVKAFVSSCSKISFHEIMCKFFKFEIPTLFQKIIKIPKILS
jgi:hypothetical protein